MAMEVQVQISRQQYMRSDSATMTVEGILHAFIVGTNTFDTRKFHNFSTT